MVIIIFKETGDDDDDDDDDDNGDNDDGDYYSENCDDHGGVKSEVTLSHGCDDIMRDLTRLKPTRS